MVCEIYEFAGLGGFGENGKITKWVGLREISELVHFGEISGLVGWDVTLEAIPSKYFGKGLKISYVFSQMSSHLPSYLSAWKTSLLSTGTVPCLYQAYNHNPVVVIP